MITSRRGNAACGGILAQLDMALRQASDSKLLPLEPHESGKTLLKSRLALLLCVFAVTAAAQVGVYQGPAILSRPSDTGMRSGQQVDLRFWASVSGIYEDGLLPFRVDDKGNLIEVKNLYGVEAALGGYGLHNWRRAQLRLDYTGTFRHYQENSYYDGSDQSLNLKYSYQKSQHMIFELRQLAGTLSLGNNTSSAAPVTDSIVSPTTLLFDNRTYYLESSMNVNFIQSPRTFYTMGGDGYRLTRQSQSLAGVTGYTLSGSVEHKISAATTIGAAYQHTHYDFTGEFGESDINTGLGTFKTNLGKRWALGLGAGVTEVEAQGIQTVAVDPAIAALLGQSTTAQAFYRRTIYPSGTAGLVRRFARASLGFSYSRVVNPGNGVYLTSLGESESVNFSYTGIRKWNFGIDATHSNLKSVGQDLGNFAQYNAGAGFTYGLTGFLHVIARYDARHEDINIAGYRRTGYRTTIGLAFSPGNIPLSLW